MLDLLRREQVEEQLSPTVEKDGPIIELDREHIGFCCLVDGSQAIADHPRPAAPVIVSKANLVEHRSIDHSGIGRPEDPIGRVNDAWCFVRSEVTL